MGCRGCGAVKYLEEKPAWLKADKNFVFFPFLIYTFKGPKKFISWASRKTQMPYCFFPVPNIVETAMEVLPLLVMYLFKLYLIFS